MKSNETRKGNLFIKDFEDGDDWKYWIYDPDKDYFSETIDIGGFGRPAFEMIQMAIWIEECKKKVKKK